MNSACWTTVLVLRLAYHQAGVSDVKRFEQLRQRVAKHGHINAAPSVGVDIVVVGFRAGADRRQ